VQLVPTGCRSTKSRKGTSSLTVAAPGGGVFGVGIGSLARGLDFAFPVDFVFELDAEAVAVAFRVFDSVAREAFVA
jgi:hypothetical protein